MSRREPQLVVIDADPIVYRAGFASERSHYDLVVGKPDGTMEQRSYLTNTTTSTDFRQYKKQLVEEGWEILDQERTAVPEPKVFALHLAKQTLEHIRKEVNRDAEVHLLLTGPGNFREEVATMKKYKGNRDKIPRPYWYDALREYMVEVQGCRVIEGQEADDEASIMIYEAHATGRATVLSTVDKDLDQVVGPHYDYAKHVWYDITQEEADQLFYQQIMTGDSTDNIPGVKGCGPATARALLGEWIEQDGGVLNEYAVWNRIVDLYAEKGVKDYEGELTPEQQAYEVALLVRMRRERDEWWLPPEG